MKFEKETMASEFYNSIHLKKYNQIEEELVILRYVKGITMNLEQLDISCTNELDLLRR